ncbi:MAG TPA: hypothetical protein P5121_12005 [Caldilineaceae bacterium]|nr:hypothetical protein [Caldilineaceae bacterium]
MNTKSTDSNLENSGGSTADTAHSSAGEANLWDSIASPAGYILAVSYPVLALSTGVRALFQLFFKQGVTDYLPPAMSGLAALCYLTATIGFAYRRRWAWWLSVAVLIFETLLTLVIGTWSYLDPALIGSTVWRHFGADYGYFPLFQPLLGLLWLFWPVTLRAYGIRK